MQGTIETTLDVLGYDSSLEIEVDYSATHGEPMVRYYRDGSGYPGCEPEAELIAVRVTRWDVGNEQRIRNDHWVWQLLDKIAHGIVEQEWNAYEYLCLEGASET